MLIFLLILVLAGAFWLMGKKDLSRKFQKFALWWVVIAVGLTVSFLLIGAIVGD